MSKERLESLKRNKEWTEATGEKFYTVDKMDYEWLIEQAGRVQELEELVEGYKIELMIKDNAKKRANQQNKRYQKAIKECVERMNKGGAGTRSFVYEKLIEVLEGEKWT